MTTAKSKKIKNFILIPSAVIIGCVVIYSIFNMPSSKSETERQGGVNATIPDGVVNELDDNKQSHYEKEILKEKSKEREQIKQIADAMREEQRVIQQSQKEVIQSKPKPQTATERVIASNEAFRDINKTLESFGDKPKVDTEKEKMQAELDELKGQLAEQQPKPSMGVDEQLALLEKSYELAAKYMPNGQGAIPQTTKATTEPPKVIAKEKRNNIAQVQNIVVSSLTATTTNRGFNTAVGRTDVHSKNTISACIHTNQTITNGQTVRLRITEPMALGDKILPRNSVITGFGKVQGERLYINITTIEHQGTVTPIGLLVADTDGQEGIYIPNSMEVSAVKEVVANLGGSLGTTINLNQQSAGDQILTDLGKGAIEGASQYIANKVREVKVHLKAGYRVMLYQEL